MKYQLVCHPKCTTCLRAKKWLDDNRIKYTERHVAVANPTAAELREWVMISRQPVNRFFNAGGIAYRESNLKDLLPSMSDDQKISLLSTDGMLLRRPLLVGKEIVLVGFKEEEWKALLE